MGMANPIAMAMCFGLENGKMLVWVRLVGVSGRLDNESWGEESDGRRRWLVLKYLVSFSDTAN